MPDDRSAKRPATGEPVARVPSERPGDFAIIIGAMKSGTSSLFDLLAQHPEISACRVKEPDFYSKQQDSRDAWQEYLSQWDWEPTKHRVALEASVSYAKAPWVPDVPRRMSSIPGIRLRFIYILRNPLRRIESQVRHGLFAGWGQSLDVGMSEDLLDFSRYAMQLDQYLEYFPRDSLLLLTLEDLQRSPDDVLRRCCRFLGVSEEFVFRGADERRNAGEFFTVPAGVGALTSNARLRSLARALLPRRSQQVIRRLLARAFGAQREIGRWRLEPAEEERVLNELAPDMKRLADDFGIEVDRLWGSDVSQ